MSIPFDFERFWRYYSFTASRLLVLGFPDPSLSRVQQFFASNYCEIRQELDFLIQRHPGLVSNLATRGLFVPTRLWSTPSHQLVFDVILGLQNLSMMMMGCPTFYEGVQVIIDICGHLQRAWDRRDYFARAYRDDEEQEEDEEDSESFSTEDTESSLSYESDTVTHDSDEEEEEPIPRPPFHTPQLRPVSLVPVGEEVAEAESETETTDTDDFTDESCDCSQCYEAEDDDNN